MYDVGYEDGFAGREGDDQFAFDREYQAGFDVGRMDRGE